MKESALLRFLDLYLGSLLCFFISAFRSRRRSPPANPRKVLVIELFEMGAALMSFSAIKELAERYPTAEIHALTTRDNKNAWALLNLIHADNIHTISGASLRTFIATTLRVWWNLRKESFDLVVDFQKFNRISTLIGSSIGARCLVGFYRYDIEGLYRGNLVDVRCSFNQNMHIAKNFLALIRTFLASTSDVPHYKGEILSRDIASPLYESDPRLKEKIKSAIASECARDLPSKIIAVFPDVGGNLSIRNYPAPLFAKAIKKLLESDTSIYCLLLGIPSNKPICDAISTQVNDARCINFCGKTETLFELMEVLSISNLLITNDNGPAHFASLCRTKTIALFSTDSPYIYGPLGDSVILYSYYHCSPCISAFNHGRSRCTDNKCLQAIPPEYVATMALRHLENELPSRTINGIAPYL